jgi:sec-independent protein translocase protein TatB
MLDIGMSELFVIGVVALVVIGPKDLPQMFRTVGRFTGKARSMARDFQRAMDNAADQTGVKDVARDLKTATSAKEMGLGGLQDAAKKFEAWDPMKSAAPAKPATPVMTPAPASESAGKPPLGPATAELAQKRAAESAALKAGAAQRAAVRTAPESVTVATPPVKADTATKPKAAPRKKAPAAAAVTAVESGAAAKPAAKPKAAAPKKRSTKPGDA